MTDDVDFRLFSWIARHSGATRRTHACSNTATSLVQPHARSNTEQPFPLLAQHTRTTPTTRTTTTSSTLALDAHTRLDRPVDGSHRFVSQVPRTLIAYSHNPFAHLAQPDLVEADEIRRKNDEGEGDRR